MIYTTIFFKLHSSHFSVMRINTMSLYGTGAYQRSLSPVPLFVICSQTVFIPEPSYPPAVNGTQCIMFFWSICSSLTVLDNALFAINCSNLLSHEGATCDGICYSCVTLVCIPYMPLDNWVPSSGCSPHMLVGTDTINGWRQRSSPTIFWCTAYTSGWTSISFTFIQVLSPNGPSSSLGLPPLRSWVACWYSTIC
jgi:hypothetical protein